MTGYIRSPARWGFKYLKTPNNVKKSMDGRNSTWQRSPPSIHWKHARPISKGFELQSPPLLCLNRAQTVSLSLSLSYSQCICRSLSILDLQMCAESISSLIGFSTFFRFKLISVSSLIYIYFFIFLF